MELHALLVTPSAIFLFLKPRGNFARRVEKAFFVRNDAMTVAYTDASGHAGA